MNLHTLSLTYNSGYILVCVTYNSDYILVCVVLYSSITAIYLFILTRLFIDCYMYCVVLDIFSIVLFQGWNDDLSLIHSDN